MINGFPRGGDVSSDGATDVNTLALNETAIADALNEAAVADPVNGTNLLGTTMSDTNGTWTIDPSTLSDGARSFTATATDATEDVSAGSQLFDVTVNGRMPTRRS